MFTIWSLIAFQLLAVLSGALTAAVALLIGGYGGQLALARRLTLAEQRVEDTDTRITKEVKKRAGEAGVEARKSDPKAVAEARLQAGAQSEPPSPSRPSVVR